MHTHMVKQKCDSFVCAIIIKILKALPEGPIINNIKSPAWRPDKRGLSQFLIAATKNG